MINKQLIRDSVTTQYHQVLNELAVLDLADAKSAEIAGEMDRGG
jgi:hypothetical protein